MVLSLLLDIPLGDMLYLDSKRSGGYDDGQYQNRCVFIQPTNITTEMQAYLNSPVWKKYIEPERNLYLAANHSLDLTIQHLGKDKVIQRLEDAITRNYKRYRTGAPAHMGDKIAPAYPFNIGQVKRCFSRFICCSCGVKSALKPPKKPEYPSA